MDESINQIIEYFENIPLWPFLLFSLLGLAAAFVEILNRKRRANAVDNFRYTIETELVALYPKHKGWPRNISAYLCSRLPEMQHNFEVLRVFIPQDRLRSYNADWNNFCEFCRTITDEKCAIAEQTSLEGNSTLREPDPKEIFHKLVENLLRHTRL